MLKSKLAQVGSLLVREFTRGGTIMLKSKLSQVGSLLVREFTRGQVATIRRSGCRRGLCSCYSPPLGSHFLSTSAVNNTHEDGNEKKEKISVTYMYTNGEETTIQVPMGMSLLEAAHENDIELEGACEGSPACSKCHVIVMDTDYYNKTGNPTDEENDMLGLTFRVTETSRLGCQVIAKPKLDGLRVLLPAATRNFAVDGHVPKPH